MAFPLEHEHEDRIAGGKFIHTKVRISENGVLDGTIHCWSLVAFSGFTGCATVELVDDKGNLLMRLSTPSIGVNGNAFSRHDVTLPFGSHLDPEIMSRVAQIDVVNQRCPQNWTDLIKKNIDDATDILKHLKGLRG